MKIVPAFLEKTPEAVKFQMDRIAHGFSRYHIDVADNTLVPNTTVSIEEISTVIPAYPGTVDLHCMVSDWRKAIDETIKFIAPSKIHVLLIHAQADPDPSVFEEDLPFPIGLVINEDESIETIRSKYNLTKINNIQIMTIKLGFQGSPFLPNMLNKIERLRQVDYRSTILIDGSVNDKTAPIIMGKPYTPDFACVGSYLIKSDNPTAAVDRILSTEAVTRV